MLIFNFSFSCVVFILLFWAYSGGYEMGGVGETHISPLYLHQILSGPQNQPSSSGKESYFLTKHFKREMSFTRTELTPVTH